MQAVADGDADRVSQRGILASMMSLLFSLFDDPLLASRDSFHDQEIYRFGQNYESWLSRDAVLSGGGINNRLWLR
jgi:hypothetical protein